MHLCFHAQLPKKNLEWYLDLIGGEACCICLGGTCVTILDRGCCACTIDFVTISDLTGGGGAFIITRLWLAVTGLLAVSGVMRGTLDTAGVVAVTVLSWGTCWGTCWV